MISSAAEFRRLRESEDPHEYSRAANEEARMETWREVIRVYPGMRFWVAHNKTVPLEILAELARDADVRVRQMVARKRKISEAIAVVLARDSDETVRAALTYNRTLPQPALDILQADPSPLVHQGLRSR